MQNQKVYRVLDLDEYTYSADPHEKVGSTYDGYPEDANIMSSEVENSDKHNVMIDLDFPAELWESSTPGHHHLYIEKEMSWDEYKDLLQALAKAGLIEEGYYSACIERGFTSLRLPHVKKKAKEK